MQESLEITKTRITLRQKEYKTSAESVKFRKT